VSPGAVGPLQEPAATQNITGEPELDALQYSRHTNVVAFETERAELYPKASTGTDSIAAGQSLPTENDRRSNEMFSGRAGRQWLVDASFGNGETKMLPDEYQSVAGKSSAVGGMRPNPTNNDLPIHATNKPVEEGSRDRGKAAFLALAGEHQTNTERSSNVVDIKQAASLLRPGKEPTAVESNSAPGPVKPSQSDFSDRASQPSNRIQSPTVAVDQAGRSIESSVADQKIAPRMHIVDEKTGNAIDTIRVSTSANEMPSGNPKGLDQQQAANQPREFKAGTLNTPESGTEFPLRNQADVSRHSEISNATVVNRSGGASLDPVQADFSFQDNEKRMAAGQQVKVADSQTVNGTSDVTKTTTESTKAFQTTVMDQIVSKAAIRSIRGRNEIQIRLKPDFLGNVHMHVVGDKDQMVVRILTDQTVVKDIIETHLHQLKADLKNQGLIIDRFDVMVKTDADHQPSRDAFTQTMNQHSSQNGKRQPQERDPENHNQGSDKKQKDAYSERSGVNYFA